jgi:hypothetical protein
MDRVQKLGNSECYKPSSDPIRCCPEVVYLYCDAGFLNITEFSPSPPCAEFYELVILTKYAGKLIAHISKGNLVIY